MTTRALFPAPFQWTACDVALPDVRTWGSTAEERTLALPCDRHVSEPDDVLWRAVTVAAPAAVVFRWLCQLRVAPYSYDWIDNGGRQSPQRLVPGLDRLEVGQRMMTLFDLVEFETGRHLTIVTRRDVMMRFAVTYLVVPTATDGCRLVVKLVAAYAPLLRPLLRRVTASADWLMMRKQLHNLKRLAEETYRLRAA